MLLYNNHIQTGLLWSRHSSCSLDVGRFTSIQFIRSFLHKAITLETSKQRADTPTFIIQQNCQFVQYSHMDAIRSPRSKSSQYVGCVSTRNEHDGVVLTRSSSQMPLLSTRTQQPITVLLTNAIYTEHYSSVDTEHVSRSTLVASSTP